MQFIRRRHNFAQDKRLQMLLESDLVLSQKLKTALNAIDSEIAKKVLSLDNKDIETRYNFIDATQNNNTVSFTADNRAQAMMGEKSDLMKVISDQRYLTHSDANNFIFRALDYEKPEGDVYVPSSGTVGRILTEHGQKTTRRGNTYVVFQNEDRTRKTVLNVLALEDYDDNKRQIWSTARNTIRIGRLVRALLTSAGIEFADSEIEEFVNKFKARVDVLNDAFSHFDIVSGYDITHWYDCNNYYSDRGTLGGSCMADFDEVSSEYFDLYAENPDKIQMVILYDDSGRIEGDRYKSNTIKGRALLWHLDNGKVFMERIYTNRDSDVEIFREFAHRNGWYYKSTNTYTTNYHMVGKDGNVNGPFVISLKNVDHDSYPYVDSLQYLSIADGQMTNDAKEVFFDTDYDDIRVLVSTSGGYEYYEGD